MPSITDGPPVTPGLALPADVPLPDRIDTIAASNPALPWVIVPRTSDVHGEWRAITFGEFANAVSGAARWIETTIGVSSKERQTVAYIG